MKRGLLASIYLFFFTAPLWANPTVIAPERQRRTQVGQVQERDDDPFRRILEVSSAAQNRYEQCLGLNVPLNMMDSCMWDEFENEQGRLPELPEADRQEITNALRAVTSKKKDKDDNLIIEDSSDFSIANAAVENLVRENDSAFMALQDYLGERLRTALYGDIQRDIADEMNSRSEGANSIYTEVRHDTFYELFKSQVSKNIIMSLSSFCIRGSFQGEGENRSFSLATPNSSSEQDIIEQNLASISQAGEVTDVLAADHWNECIQRIPTICNPVDDEGRPVPRTGSMGHTQREACALNRSLRSARQALIEVDHIQEAYREFSSEGVGRVFGQQSLDNDSIQVREYDSNNEHSSIDRLTTFTSGEVHNSTNEFNQENQSLLEKFTEQCFDGENIVGDQETCAPFLEGDIEQSQKRVAELSLRTRAIGERLREMEGDESAMRDYLEQEGYSREEIEAMVASAGDTEQLLDIINQHYDNQREALVQSIANQINQRTITSEQWSDDQGAVQDTLQRIYDELTNRVDRFTQLVHYNNVVGSFLRVGQGDGEQRANTAMLQRELNSSFFDPGNSRGIASATHNPEDRQGEPVLGGDYFAELQDRVSDHLGSDNSFSGQGTTAISVADINKNFLNYIKSQSE